jgi:hypothetical protein
MALDEDQVGRLVAAGCVQVPSDADYGLIIADPNGIVAGTAGAVADWTIEIAHYASPAHKTTYVVPLRNIAAIFLPDGLPGGGPPTWLTGDDFVTPAAAAPHGRAPGRVTKLPVLGASPIKGSVFMPECAGLLMRTEVAMTAGDVGDRARSCA